MLISIFSFSSFTVEGLTEEEQKAEEERLYAAIGYSESDAPVKLPPEVCNVKLNSPFG